MDYLAGGSIGQHEWPKFVLVSGLEYSRLTKVGEDSWAQTFTVDDLPDRIDQLIPLSEQEALTPEEEEQASIHASKLMVDLYNGMVSEDADEGVGEEAPNDPEDEGWAVQKTSVPGALTDPDLATAQRRVDDKFFTGASLKRIP